MDLSFLPDQDTEEECAKFKAITKRTILISLTDFLDMVEDKHHDHLDRIDDLENQWFDTRF